MTVRPTLLAAAAAWGLTMTPPPLHADEGMWLFNNPPRKQLKEKYGFDPTDAWLDHVQKSSVRFNSGGSGSFVSADGLVMTNHHVGADDLQKLSTAEKNYLRDGFHAKNRGEEIKCKGLELNVLQGIKDVTAEVNAAVTDGLKPGEAFAARQKKIGELQQAAAVPDKAIKGQVVTLYQGGAYHLYTLKKYTDIRLVFAPEKQIAFFGGDPDNFEYPRFDLDMCFFRVYENDAAIKCEHFLKWSANGAAENELIFVSGHPGRTNRQQTIAELEYLRDHAYPNLLNRLYRMEVVIGAWVERSEANRQKGEDDLFGIQNSRKARIGGLAGLLDPAVMGQKKAAEERLRQFIAASSDAEVKKAAGAFDAIAKAETKRKEIAKEYGLLEQAGGFNSAYFGIARALLRAAAEKPKATGDRLREFAESELPSFEFQLFSDEPHYPDFEAVKLADSLTTFATTLGADDPLVQQVLAGKSPRDRAFELVTGTKVGDVAARKSLYAGGQAAVDAAKDPMIELARMIDGRARAVRKVSETEVEEPKRQAYAALAKARFAQDGTNTYPDATFTLRLSYGTVAGYAEAGAKVPAFTDLGGVYERSKAQGNKGPFELPPRWEQKKGSIDLKTPFNFVSTADIIGGNSGSPVVNKNGEVVGLIFDGNIQSLVLDFAFEQQTARAVSVDSRAIVEALRKVYDAGDLADELTGKKK